MKKSFFLSIIIIIIFNAASHAEDKYISEDMRSLYTKYSKYFDNNNYEIVLFKELLLFSIDTKDYDLIKKALHKVGYSRYHEVLLLIENHINNIDSDILKLVIKNMLNNMRNIELIGRAENDERIKKIVHKIEMICRNYLNKNITMIIDGSIDVDNCLRTLDDPVPR